MRFSCPPLPGFSDDARTPRVAPGANLRPPLSGLRKTLFGVLVLMGVCLSARAESLPPAKPAPGSVQVMFLPPPLEAGAVYSVGVYDAATGRLVRRLHEDAEDGAFTAGLNGFITFWDRKDDAGKTLPAAKYAARGWAVGEMKVEGEAILGNDWTNEDENLRVKNIWMVNILSSDGGLIVLALMADGRVEAFRVSGRDGALLWRQQVTDAPSLFANTSATESGRAKSFRLIGSKDDRVWSNFNGVHVEFALKDGREISRQPINNPSLPPGDYFDGMDIAEDNTVWLAFPTGLFQFSVDIVFNRDPPPRFAAGSPDRPSQEATRADEAWLRRMQAEAQRYLPVELGDPVIRTVSVSRTSKRLYLLEESPGWQRVRGLEWSDTKPDASGHPVSEWRTFFERSIRRPDPALGLDEKAPSPVVELPLARNPLDPGKPQRAKLRAGFDAKGSYLETADGLRLLPVSTRLNLRAARLVRDPKAPDRLLFYQFDGAAWDVFGITGVPTALVAFDAGEFELTADGEHRPAPPEGEPQVP